MSKKEIVVSDVLQWIESNIDHLTSVDEIVVKSGYSKWHLLRIFNQVAGVSLPVYFRRRRLTLAAYEIKNTKDSLLTIAVKYHFSSHQAFTRAFKKQFTQSPKAYRKSTLCSYIGIYPSIIESKPLPSLVKCHP